MRFSAVEKYGLRCLMTLARISPKGQLSISDIAEREGLSVPYASKLLSILRKSGLVVAERGGAGGFSIARPPRDVTLLKVLTALGGPLLEPDHCAKHTGQLERCVHEDACSVHGVLGGLAGYMSSILESTNLQDMLDYEDKVLKTGGGRVLLDLGPLDSALRGDPGWGYSSDEAVESEP